MKRTILPMFAATPVISARKTEFKPTGGEETFTIEAPGKLFRELANVCDGKHSVGQIAESLRNKWDGASVRSLIKELLSRHLLVDGRDITDKAWELVENPTGYPLALSAEEKAHLVEKARQRHKDAQSGRMYRASPTAYGALLSRRRSIRSFSGKVGMQSIVNLLWSAYGETSDGHRTVPSAGALYPLIVHVALLRSTEDLEPAVYRVHLGSPRSVRFELASKDIGLFARSFIDPMTFEGAHGVIVISGSFRITAEKYGSRSMLFVTLEAGHAAQNINIAAVEQGVATVEAGGFRESILRDALDLPERYHPLIATAFGGEGAAVPASTSNQTIEVRWDVPTTGRYRPPFAMASARVVGRRSWSHGRDASVSLAFTKAVSEAREWASCGSVPDNLVRARLAELGTAIDPKNIIKFHPSQYRLKGFPFKPLDENTEYEWTQGRNETTGKTAHILADLVYFPYFPTTPYYAYANSSGVAAHPDRRQALETSVLELVERDSFMISYLARLELPTIKEETLPRPIRVRIRELGKAGFRVWVKDHSLDLAPVVSIVVQSEQYECTICASCASFDCDYAVDHALKEVEAPVLARIHNGKLGPIRPKEVVMPLHHGMLYGQKRYFKRADFLTHGKTASFRNIGHNVARTWKDLLGRFKAKGWQHYTVDLHLSANRGGNWGLNIVRSIVPGMVPMTFGYRQEPAGMERIYSVARDFKNQSLSYGDITKFPHPFE